MTMKYMMNCYTVPSITMTKMHIRNVSFLPFIKILSSNTCYPESGIIRKRNNYYILHSVICPFSVLTRLNMAVATELNHTAL